MRLISFIFLLLVPTLCFGADNGQLPENQKLKFSPSGQPNILSAVLSFKDHGKRYEAVFEEAPERIALKVEEKGLFRSHLIYALPEDPNVIGFTPECGIRWIKVKEPHRGFLSFSSGPEMETHPVVFVARRMAGETKVWITIIGFDGDAIKTLLNVKCDHYDVKDFKNDGHEDIICYYQYKIPELFSYQRSISGQNQSNSFLGNMGQAYQSTGRYAAGFYDAFQNQLEQAIGRKDTVDKSELYFDHVQLRDIDYAKMTLASDKNALKVNAEKEERLAEKYQPTAPKAKNRIKARFYPFLLKRRVFTDKGTDSFKTYKLNTSGNLVLMSKNTGAPNGDDARILAKLDKGFFAESPISHSGNYKIKLYADEMNRDSVGPLGWLIVTDNVNRSVNKIKIPDQGFSWKVVGWHPLKDIFYFSMTQGPNTARIESLWQYDAVKKSILKIGVTNGKAYLSPDQRWILWETGGEYQTIKNKNFSVFHLNEFDVNKGVNYELTPKASDNMFIRWVK